MKKINLVTLFSAYLFLFGFTQQVNAIQSNDVGTKTSFNEGWLFSKGDLKNAQSITFNDTAWRKLKLPHDWSIEGPFDKKYNARNGGLPVFGTAWYRKHFTLPQSSEGKIVSVTFDGAMDNSEVYVNGQYAGGRPFGYIAFELDITPFLNKAGSENVISVKLAPKNYSARWYAGAGIYRNTWLEINNPVHVEKWGTYVTTPKITKKKATILLETDIKNHAKAANITVNTKIKNAEGQVVSSSVSKVNVAAESIEKVKQEITLLNPILWDIDNPYRYEIETIVIQNSRVVDTYKTPLGVRTIEFKPEDGFWLNGRRVQIQGVSLHHDNGPLGAAVYTRAIERKFEIMQQMGANSVRTTHNPPSPELVELADKMGILLQIESFDMWQIQKPTIDNGYHLNFDEWHERDLRDMIKQNRNNPSVIMWSTGNEVHEQKEKDGWKLTRKLTEIAHDEDPSRLVTNGLSMYPYFLQNKLADELDIVGLNYKAPKYKEILDAHPDWLLLGTETSSVVSTRGVYHFPIEKYRKHPSKYVTSYDIITPPWAYIPDIEFAHLKDNPRVMGEYIWTGFDYLGEPTPYGGRDHGNRAYWNQDWPARSSSFGAVDLVGFPKDRFYLYQSQWTKKPMVHLLPHWNWDNKLGETLPVFVYTNAEEAELFVNGKSYGKKVKGKDKVSLPVKLKLDKSLTTFETPYRLSWDVKYTPGDIKVVAYNQGKVVAEKQIFTAGKATNVELTPDRVEINADGTDLVYVSALIKDKKGNLVPNANNLIEFTVEGAGEVVAVGNGDSATVESFVGSKRHAFYGKAMLIVKSKKGQTGKIKISAKSVDLASAPVSVIAK
ncbi:glycoside hydrolase family 2 TIM barrel-domain containing protein [Colwellia sp. UCD-KL20]|uniref:glycoside hydrolase family 2 TIM barrel-domain containing protein n=1 Tax=Colwellia sp. UCD-KL20 TaxID=1917165 RepID=UPI0025711A26|nr:glycoside hydrolase family 2 TIM barrel-domain containing protein [Colwellia sp. UCD-KL20]